MVKIKLFIQSFHAMSGTWQHQHPRQVKSSRVQEHVEHPDCVVLGSEHFLKSVSPLAGLTSLTCPQASCPKSRKQRFVNVQQPALTFTQSSMFVQGLISMVFYHVQSSLHKFSLLILTTILQSKQRQYHPLHFRSEKTIAPKQLDEWPVSRADQRQSRVIIPDTSDSKSSPSGIQQCRIAFLQDCLWDKPEDDKLDFVSDRLMHEEEASHCDKLLPDTGKVEL